MASIDLAEIRHALAVARDRGLGEVELESGETRFRAVLGKRPRSAPISAPAEPTVNLVSVTAPVVGFLGKVSANLHVGARVTGGEILAAVVSLGLPTDLEAPCSGEVVEVHGADGDGVEYGQLIAVIRREDA